MTFVGLHLSPTDQYGDVDEQVELVARQLKGIPFLSDAFDAIGFSQGSYCENIKWYRLWMTTNIITGWAAPSRVYGALQRSARPQSFFFLF